LVSSFAAAKVSHPIVAIFDNDSAGLIQFKKLEKLKLPKNIKVLTLPDIKIAEKYPTLGPTGLVKMNVNGKACSIEMFFGREILKINNSLSPVRWLNYEKNLDQYHGVISDKKLVMDKFLRFIESDKFNPSNLNDLDKVLNSIFDVFSNNPVYET
jgi:hypothetical protein